MGEITLGAAGNSAPIAFPSPHGLPLFRDGGAVSAGLSQIAASLLQMRKGSIAHMSDAKKGAGTRETARAWLGTRDPVSVHCKLASMQVEEGVSVSEKDPVL
jgi:hypothetical protein